MHGRSDHERLELPGRAPATQRTGETARPASADGTTLAPTGADPRLAGGGGAPVLLGLQTTAGNRAVQRLIAEHGLPAVQRAIDIEQIASNVGPASGPASAGGGAAGPATATPAEGTGGDQAGFQASEPTTGEGGDAGDLVGPGGTAPTGGGTTITDSTISLDAAMINLNAGMTTSSGVIRAGTIVADTVIASTYTPGVGNIM